MKKFPWKIFRHYPLQSEKNESIDKCYIFLLIFSPIIGKLRLDNDKMKLK